MNASPATPATALMRAWESASVQQVWLRPGDWYTPAAEALAEALEARLDTAPAAYRLGQARSAAGVGITETIDDVSLVFKAAGFDATPIRTIRALCQGWTEGSPDMTAVPTMTDSESGLGTAEYVIQRLAEVYGDAQRNGTDVTVTHAMVMVDVSVDSADPWHRMARNAAIGEALRSAYGAGHPMARLGEGLYAVLVRRDQSLGTGIAHLRDHVAERAVAMRVENLMRQPPRVWIESLPATHDYARALVESLQR